MSESELAAELRARPALYAAVGLEAGAVIALQICIMRVFAVGSWAHFGSLVVSLAMLGFGLASATMCIAKGWFERHWRGLAMALLAVLAPLMAATNLGAQQLEFNPIFLLSDRTQKWRLLAVFLLYMLPFLAGAYFLGVVFLRAQRIFGRVYFADLTGAGLGGLLVLAAMYVLPPENLILAPLLLTFAGGVLWAATVGRPRQAVWPALGFLAALLIHFGAPAALAIPRLAVSDYKGVAYARKFPDSRRVYERPSPFGYLEVYSSSYLHFAPGLSDNAAFNLPRMPVNAYLGMYLDGEGPTGVIRSLPPEETAYFRFLPMDYPYRIAHAPRTFVVQFGGGISTAVALAGGASHVTIAESNPTVLAAFRDDPGLRAFTGDVLRDPRVSVVPYDGRLYLASTRDRFDVIDLSLADSTGLSSPGGFAIVEKYAYTREALAAAMRALAERGILSVTLWNKEEPPKSVLKLYATMAAAARDVEPGAPGSPLSIGDRFFVASSYLSTTTVLYQHGGFDAAELRTLRDHTRALSFDEIYSPGQQYDDTQTAGLLGRYREQIFPTAAAAEEGAAPSVAEGGAEPADGEPAAGGPAAATPAEVPATTLGRCVWYHLVRGDWDRLSRDYVFDSRPLTNDRPYFAAYVRPPDLPRVRGRLEILQDEWGYLLLWATLAIACLAAASLVALPVVFGWRAIFRRSPGKLLTIVYFACLGLGYIMVEVGLISHFTLALSNATVSASVLITGMLVCSGLGSYVSERYLDSARRVMPRVFLGIGALLIAYGMVLDRPLDWIGTLPYGWRMVACFALVFPPAFLMGFPMPTAMTSLARLGKEHMFLWAWGINGCFSVVGAALVPLAATSFGLSAVLWLSGGAYLLALPAFFGVLRSDPRAAAGVG